MTTPNAPDDAHGMDPQSFPNSPDDRLGAKPGDDLGDRTDDRPDDRGSDRSSDRRDDGSRDGSGDGIGDEIDDDIDHRFGEVIGDDFTETVDEAALRAMMQEAVSGLHGSPDALDHLRRAIPIRRQRRRQALVGAAAVLLLAGMAVPALLRATGTGHGADTTAASTAKSHTGAPGEDGHTSAWGASSGPAGHPSAGPGQGPKQQQHPTGGADGPSSRPTRPSDTVVPVPECSGSQLGQGASNADAPDSGGRVYGWFRVANVSDTACTVPSDGVVNAVAQGAADSSRIQIVDHTAGDAATGLPSAPSSGPVVLKPGEDYEVAFAWVPASDGTGGCPVAPTTPPTTPTPSPTPTDTVGTDPGSADPGSSGGSGSSGTSDNSVSTQLGEDAPVSPASGSVTLNHTPAPGAPVVDGPVIQDACAGTVYTTAAIPEPADTPAS
ncbi:hypothetical protein GA0115240_10147 [Streptomyces sp. DvalAA-14]|uniref:hypothetical protein n=1 Tax=unclassified Streptomyces TaxID=2593676 RepID=UPI00081B5A03|nr:MULTISPECIES: hypothetical protein [unclassified Streptomyces]MYS18851.1 hypothetical protein [Streptomyces sp. SID4948]SCD30560.1 hypothetical protein GA0115240_10147 [Streptomyces sp. DvalAA-14]